ncbi:hypothetical protein A4X13_0g2240 [Tilletia indica]|uniref:Uncharacterized protein n=1 Tax=Tilletia indica TaxID=43049 RepID=A0A8T8TB42_9BASI|nr:hypothetical protein A4X13_0g2240 [Tilletia indica]
MSSNTARFAGRLGREATRQRLRLPETLPLPPEEFTSLPLHSSSPPPVEHLPLPVPSSSSLPIPSTAISLFSRQETSPRKRRRKKSAETGQTRAQPVSATKAAKPASPRPDPRTPTSLSSAAVVPDDEGNALSFGPTSDDGFDNDWSFYGTSEPLGNDFNPADISMDYASMLFNEHTAYMARIDSRTWVIEGIINGFTEIGQFYHLTLYEGTGLAGSEDLASSFCSTIRHSYEQHAPGTSSKFVARTTFIKLYFAFVALQQLDVSFSCSICGPTPAIVIADGVVLAYSAALKHAELRPPTTPGVSINEKARKGSIVSFLPSAAARAAARQFAVSLDASTSEQVDVLQSFTIAIEASKSIPLSLRLWIGHFKQLMIDISLSDDIPPGFKMGLQQLVLQFSAHDGILQLCRPFCRSTLSSLSSIDITSTSDDHFARLSTTLARHCPFLGNVFVLLAHNRTNLTSSEWVRSLQLLMASTSDAIDYQLALLDPRPTPPPSTIPQQLSYTQTGTLYGAPQCRTRPAYPRLEEGKEGKSGEKQAMQEGVQEGDVQCRKFYDERA